MGVRQKQFNNRPHNLQAVMLANLSVFILLFFGCSSPKENNTFDLSANDTLNANTAKPAYLTSCGDYLREAMRMDSILLIQTDTEINLANKAIRAFTEFAANCPNDSLAPVYLIKTAQVAKAVNNIPQAKLVLDKCIEDYSGFKDRASAIFLLAQLYDENTYLNNENEARKLYQQIIDEYPKSAVAASAAGAIKFLGKTDEEILREFTKSKK